MELHKKGSVLACLYIKGYLQRELLIYLYKYIGIMWLVKPYLGERRTSKVNFLLNNQLQKLLRKDVFFNYPYDHLAWEG